MCVSSSTRTAIFTKTLRIVAKVAPRQRDLLGAARRNECRSQYAPNHRARPRLVARLSPRLIGARPRLPGGSIVWLAVPRTTARARNRSACFRIPMYSHNPRAKRVEFRTPDPSCNGYLAFAAMLMAGLDGIQNRIDPGGPIHKNLYDLPPQEAEGVRSTPGSLGAALDALDADHAFLLEGDVFTKDVIEIGLPTSGKRRWTPVALRPHPYEFHLYYDV
jgi:hypothetical protein